MVRATGSRLLFPEGGYRVEETWDPPLADERGLALARRSLADVEAAMEPAERGVLLARVLALLSHYRAEANHRGVEMMIADDWAEDLGEFPLWAVEEAARSWRRSKKFRPQICEIRELCEAAASKAITVRDRLRRVVASNSPPDRRVEALRLVARITFPDIS